MNQTFFPGSGRRCYECFEDDCKDPYTANSQHIVNCLSQWDYCAKLNVDKGKWLHNRHIDIYKRELHKISEIYNQIL